ncbi:MAG: zinc ribbon domain-containing protein [Desulfobacterales bacterium]|nr:zinc ribbon domain-containing protein [Desulfobacterales bacterium]
MPVFDFQCSACGSFFEALVRKDEETVRCAECGKKDAKKLLSAPSFSIKKGNATGGIEKRVKDYLKTGNFSEATRFADRAASLVKSDKVKKIQEKLHQKTG